MMKRKKLAQHHLTTRQASLCHRQTDDGQKQVLLCPHLVAKSGHSVGRTGMLVVGITTTDGPGWGCEAAGGYKWHHPRQMWQAHPAISSLYPGICRGCWSLPPQWCCPGDARQCAGSSYWSPNYPRWFHPFCVCRLCTPCGASGPAWACCFHGTPPMSRPVCGRDRTSWRSCYMSRSSPHCPE